MVINILNIMLFSNFWIYGLMKECGGGNNAGPSFSGLDSVTIYARWVHPTEFYADGE